MYYVSKVDLASAQVPPLYRNASTGFSRSVTVNRTVGSVHMGAGVCYLEPGGVIQPHLHAFEESFILLEGELTTQIGEQVYRLGPGYYGLIPTGTPHAFCNSGDHPARWLEMQAPQPRESETHRDTFFIGGPLPAGGRIPIPGDPADALIGFFDENQLPHPGGPSQMEGFNPTTGVAIKMFVDRSFGAIHQSLFLIQYQPGAKIDPHDHTFEESYLIVSGRVHATADDQSFDLGPGDVIWTGVGCVHSFANLGDEPVRWIETQSPLPPAREVFRFERDWARYAETSQGGITQEVSME